VSEVPVHKLFKKLDNPQATVADALKEFGADFEVKKRPVFAKLDPIPGKVYSGNEEELAEVPGYASVVKDDGTPLSIMGDRYGIIQYRTAFDFLNSLIGNRQIEIYSGACVEEGAKLHIVVKTPDYIEIAPGERFDCFFTVSASHDGTGCLQAMCSPVHNIAQTVFTPMGRGVVKIKHSAKVEARLATANRMFASLHRNFIDFSGNIKDMVGIQLTDQEVRDYFLSVVDGDSKQAENTRKKLHTIYLTGLTSKLSSCTNTLFGAFMAIQQYADYYKTVRKAIRRNETDARIEARLTGDGAKLKAESFSMALAIVRNFS
jgi:phage/plasmid-like protein (TIGR03299 family)